MVSWGCITNVCVLDLETSRKETKVCLRRHGLQPARHSSAKAKEVRKKSYELFHVQQVRAAIEHQNTTFLSQSIYPHTRVHTAATRTTSKGPHVSDVRTKAESTTTAANLVTCKKQKKKKRIRRIPPPPRPFIPPCQFQRRRTVLRAECLCLF